MKSYRVIALLVSLLFGVVLATAVGRLIIRSRVNDTKSNFAGRLEVRGVYDLGCVPIGTMVPASIKITNRGREDVLANKFKTDCSCVDVYINRDGMKELVTELPLKPDETKTVRVDMLINGEPGFKVVSSIGFQEADRPDLSYQVKIFYTPIARFYTIPRVVQFGDLRIDGTASRRVELRSDGSLRHFFENISMRSSPAFSMRFTPAGEADRASDTLKGQELLGFVDLSCHPRGEEREIREELTFIEGDEVLGKVTATANIQADFTMAPRTLVLPRYEGGKPVYSGWFHCRSRSGRPFVIVTGSESSGFRLRLEGPDVPSASFKVSVTFLGSPPADSTKSVDLTFKIRDESGERPVTLHTRIDPADQ